MESVDIRRAQRAIDRFASKWQRALFEHCNNNQKLAAWCLWTHYLRGLRSMGHLCAVNDV